MGIFSLHSKYAGSRRNRFWLAACAVFTLATQILLEYSFSSTQIEQFESVPVWEGSPHQAHYFASDNFTSIDDEPTRFLNDLAKSCVVGPRAFNRSQNEIPDYPEVKTKLTYNATFRIRSPYMRRDNGDVACGAVSKEQRAYFMIPSIVEVEIGYEGLDAFCKVDPFYAFPFWFHRLRTDKFRVTGRFNFEGARPEVYIGEHSVCVMEDGNGVCAVSNGTEIVIGRAFGSTAPNILRCIHMFASGEGVQQLHEQGRKVRFLAYLFETRVYDPDWSKQIERLVPISTLEHVAQVALVVANEGGVVGVEELASLREIDRLEMRDVTTVSVLAIVPVTILLVAALGLAAYDLLLRMTIAKMAGKEKGSPQGLFSHSRVEMSIDWLRDRVAADLTRSGLSACTVEDVRVRLVGHGDTRRLQVLPDLMGKNDMYD